MKSLATIRDELETLKPRLAEKYHVSEIGIFGSVARNEGTAESDLDLVVAFDEPVSLFDLVRLEQELAEHLDIEVDVVTKRSLKPRVAARVQNDVVYV
jgi:predicted nucleotidyltransferase